MSRKLPFELVAMLYVQRKQILERLQEGSGLFGVLPLYGQLCDYGSLQSHIHLAVTDALLG